MPDHEAGVQREMPLEAAQIVGEGSPLEGHTLLERRQRHPFDDGKHLQQVGRSLAVRAPSVNPQFPLMVVVTPCRLEGDALPSHMSCAS